MKNLLLLMFMLLIGTLLAPVSFPQEKEQIKKLVQRADLIIQAEVVETKSRPGHWAGYVPAYQEMVYKVEKVIKGSLDEKHIIVDHAVVYNSRTADKNIPQLSEELFQPGRKFILFLEVKKNGRVGRFEDEVIEDPTDRPLRILQVGKDKLVVVQIEVEGIEDPADRLFRYVVLSENFGALSYSEDTEKLVRKYLKRQKKTRNKSRQKRQL